MRTLRSLALASAAAVVTLLTPGVAAAHALLVKWEVRTAEVYVEAGYSYGPDAEPAEGAAVTVTGANGKPIAAGATDERGVWTFPRPAAGTYTVVVEQAGHRTEVTVGVPETGTAAFFPSRFDERVGVAVGVVVVLGLTLAYRTIRRRQ
jgi:hypothetical protein